MKIKTWFKHNFFPFETKLRITWKGIKQAAALITLYISAFIAVLYLLALVAHPTLKHLGLFLITLMLTWWWFCKFYVLVMFDEE